MLALTLIATLSLSLINALDQGKGSLFPTYFYIYRGVKYAVQAMLIMMMDSLLPIALLVDPLPSSQVLSLILVILILNHSIVKSVAGSLLHYTGSFRPSLLALGKWYVLNYFLSAEPPYVLVVATMGYLTLLFFVISYISLRIITWTFPLSAKVERIRKLCSLNYDKLRLIVSLLLILSVIMMT